MRSRRSQIELDKIMSNRIEISPQDERYIKLNIIGENNTVIVKKLASDSSGKLLVSIAGNNCSVIIDEGVHIGTSLEIIAGRIHPNFGMMGNTHIFIGKRTSFESVLLMAANANSSIEIGERCMFSYNINVYNTDMHPILRAEDKSIINKVGKLKIGDHVWVGYDATILKNTTIADDCIIGWGSVVSSKYGQPTSGSIIAGNPAKIVKTGVTWDSNGSKGYIQNADGESEICTRAKIIMDEPPSSYNFQYKKNGDVLFNFDKKGLQYRLWKYLSLKEDSFIKRDSLIKKLEYKIYKHLSKKHFGK